MGIDFIVSYPMPDIFPVGANDCGCEPDQFPGDFACPPYRCGLLGEGNLLDNPHSCKPRITEQGLQLLPVRLAKRYRVVCVLS